MKVFHWITGITLVVLLELAIAGWVLTRGLGPPPAPEPKELAARQAAAEAAVKIDEDSVAELTRKLATAPESQKENLQDQLEVAKGQLELDQYEVDEAAEDLAPAGAYPGARVPQLKAEHDASDKEPESAPSPAAISAEQNYQAHTLLHVFRAWRELHSQRLQIAAARQGAAAGGQN